MVLKPLLDQDSIDAINERLQRFFDRIELNVSVALLSELVFHEDVLLLVGIRLRFVHRIGWTFCFFLFDRHSS